MAVFVEAFYYRFRQPGETEAPTFHVEIVSEGVDGFGDKTVSRKTVGVQQAQELGFNLESSVSGINAQALLELEMARQEIEQLQGQISALEDQVNAAKYEAAVGRATEPKET